MPFVVIDAEAQDPEWVPETYFYRCRREGASAMRWLLGFLGVAFAIAFLAFLSAPAPTGSERAAAPSSRQASIPPFIPKTRFTDSDISALKAKYGQPSEEDSTAYDNPRPPMVMRWLIYNNQRIRFVFVADGKLGDPPPYSRWLYLGTQDERTKEPLKPEEIEQRFARGEAPVLLPVPRPKAPATPYEQANIAVSNDDEESALKVLRPLAERGDPKAEFMVGELYYLFKKQNAEALKWFRLASNQGNAGAMYYLGNMHHNGNGVPQNYVEAYKWYSLAVSQAGPREKEMDTLTMATENRDGVARRMTPAQVADAQRQAKEWKPAPKRQAAPGTPINLSPK